MTTVHLSDRLADICVGDLMHAGVVSCASDATLAEAACLLAAHRVHALAVVRPGRLRPLGFVSDAELLAALAAGSPFDGDDALTAGDVASGGPLAISSREPAARAAQCMHEHGTTHLLVVDHAGGYPVGVLSSLDLLAACAGLASDACTHAARPGGPPPFPSTEEKES